MTWKNDYTKSRVWAGNEYLVQPETAVKQCACCQERKYSSEFVDFDGFIDHKLPACIACLRKRDGSGRDVVRESGVTTTCRKCEREVLVGDMSIDYASNRVGKTCMECTRVIFLEAFDD